MYLINLDYLPKTMPVHLKSQFDVAIIAHRGYKKKYPENTLLAFQKAMEAKADYIELDVRKTKDGVLVVNHDRSTLRITGKKFIIDKTDFATLRTLSYGQGERIPTLQEVLELCKGKLGLQIELKSIGSAEPMVSLVSEFGVEQEVLVSSFNHSEVAKVKKLNPNLICAVLEPSLKNFSALIKRIFNRQNYFDDAEKYGVEGIHPLFLYASKSFCTKAHDRGLFVNAWTVDIPFLWKKLIEAGVDGIITNEPKKLYDFLSES
ncbi:MAG: glycerophosphodiester phosphodiesterase [Promethearchaeota archaeon]